MFHVRKKKWMGCAVASAAMLAGVSYEEAEAHWPDLDEARLRWPPREFRSLLESLTGTEWHLCHCWFPPRTVRKFQFPEWPIAIFTQDSAILPRFGQWIVVQGKIVHDPQATGACVVNRYVYRDWFVSWTLQPTRPPELANYLTRTRVAKILKAFRTELASELGPCELEERRIQMQPGHLRDIRRKMGRT